MRFHRLIRTTILATLPLLVAATATAQSRLHAGGAFTFAIEPKSDTLEYPGGTTWGGSALLGVGASRRITLEGEVSIDAELTDEYTYRPFQDQSLRVVWTRRDTFYTFQLRWRGGALEPVAGFSYIRSTADQNARYIPPVPSNQPYFDDHESDNAVGIVAGIDGAIKLSSRAHLVPTFRVVVRPSEREPLPNTENAGPILFRFGAGVRIAF